MTAKAHAFDVGDYVVYPKHGVGRVIELLEQLRLLLSSEPLPLAPIRNEPLQLLESHVRQSLAPVDQPTVEADNPGSDLDRMVGQSVQVHNANAAVEALRAGI